MDHPEPRPQPSGLTADGVSTFASAFSSAASKDDHWWTFAEHQAAALIASIQPIHSSDKRRQDIVDFVRTLIQQCFDFQVQTFGSVPLKTYLPDGDIDLTVLSVHTDMKDSWAPEVVKALKIVEESADARFRVKDVQYILADVKIIKCLVENIVVDISFNQTGGLNTFFFLEEVDRLIGRDHLFKKSIILVKAWCYYESRLLGAHHGLISTYALETLVLYIFHVFHASLRGPLKVLYTFLFYFSNFDWDKYCITIWGPLPLTAITERVSVHFAESPRIDGGRLLLPKEFLDKCIEDYSGVSSGLESNQGRHFTTKFLNVLDPIRDTNNLGRSVNVGSFKRIRSAFGFGARTLGEVLKESSEEKINEKLKSFFSCTFTSLERYHKGGRPDTCNLVSHGMQHPFSGAGSSNFHERVSSGYKQEKGLDTRHSPRPASYMGERATPPITDVPFSNSSGRESGNTVESAPDTKQERLRATEPSLAQPISSNSNVTSSEGQWRQVGGKGRFPNAEGDAAKGSNYFTAQENFDRSVPNNRRSNEEHEHANHSVFRSPMGDEYQARAPSQDSPRWGSSRGDVVGQGSVSRSRDISEPGLSTYDVGTPPGDSKPSTSHQNANGKLLSGDENDTSTSGRKAPSSEESKAIYNKRASQHRAYVSPVDISNQGNSPDAGNQNMPQLSSYQLPPFLTYPQIPSHPYRPMHLQISSGPASASSLHPVDRSPSSGESFPSWVDPYVGSQAPHILSPAFPTTSSCMVSVAPSGDGVNSHNVGFASRAENQWEHRRFPLEDQAQQLHRTSSASSGRSFPMESTSLSEGYPSPSSVPRKFALGRSNPAQGGSVRSLEPAEYLKAYGSRDESLSRLSLSDERSPSHSEEGADHVAFGMRNREYRQNSSEVKVSDGKHAKGTKGAEQLSRSQSFGDRSDRDVARNVDGHAAELRPHRIWHPSFVSSPVPLLSAFYHNPPGTDCPFRGDSVAGLHSNGSMDFRPDNQGSQSLQDARFRTKPQVDVGVAERPKGGAVMMSPRNIGETSMSDEAGPCEFQDILYGSSKADKEKVLREFLNSLMSFKGPQLGENPGRQKGTNLNLHAGLNISQPLGGAGPAYASRGRAADGAQQSRAFGFHSNEDTLPKPRAGTGAYLPTPGPTYPTRGRSGPGGRGGNPHGAYGQPDRNSLEGSNQLHASRYRSVGQGQGQQSRHDPRVQLTMNAQKNPAPELGDSSSSQQQQQQQQQQHQSVEKRGVPSHPSQSSQPTSPGCYVASSNGYPPPVSMQHDGSSGITSELEFGSLGPVPSG